MRNTLRLGFKWFVLLMMHGCIALSAQAQQSLLPFQGQLTDQAGVALSPTAPLTLVFRLYENPVGGTVLWEEVQPNIGVIAGRFSVLLGSRVPFQDQKSFSRTIYLGITVDDGDAATADVEMRPRQAVVPLIYAANSSNAEKLNGHDWRDILVNGNNDPGSGLIRADKIEGNILTRLIELERQFEFVRTVENMRGYSPVGTIMPFAGRLDKIPPTWEVCDCTSISNVDYPVLFSVISTAWGGDGSPNFNLPDLMGRFLRGVDKNRNGEKTLPQRDSDRGSRTPIHRGGNSGIEVGSIQDDATKRPNQAFTTGGGSHAHQYEKAYERSGLLAQAGRNGSASWLGLQPNDVSGAGAHSHTMDGGGDEETRPKNAYVYWIIKVRY